MENKLIAGLITIVVIALGIMFVGCVDEETSVSTPASTPGYTVGDAIDNDFVKAEIRGSGASSGDSINLELTRLTSYTIEITVPKGTVLPASDGSQNMVVWKVSGKPNQQLVDGALK